VELPASFRQFDYNTISDVILHMRYTARQGGGLLGGKAAEYLEELVGEANAAGLALLFSLRHDFPSEWHKFVVANADSPSPSVPFSAKVKREYFPYFTQGKDVSVNAIQVIAIRDEELDQVTLDDLDLGSFSSGLNDEVVREAVFKSDLVDKLGGLPKPHDPVFIVIKYSLESA